MYRKFGEIWTVVFTARRHASAVYDVVVCLFVRPSVTRRKTKYSSLARVLVRKDTHGEVYRYDSHFNNCRY